MFAGVLDQNLPESRVDREVTKGWETFHSFNNPATREQPKDDNLIASAKAGDLNAFNTLVLAYQDSLYWWVLSLVHDEALADDLVQSTFITAYEKLDIYNGGSFRAWLFRIARNRSFDELRRLKRRPSISLDAPAGEGEEDRDLLSFVSTDIPFPEDLVIQAEQAEQILRLLDRLPQAFRQVLQLVDMDGMDYRDAADLLGLPLGTFKSRVSRARLKLRDLVVQSGQFVSSY